MGISVGTRYTELPADVGYADSDIYFPDGLGVPSPGLLYLDNGADDLGKAIVANYQGEIINLRLSQEDANWSPNHIPPDGHLFFGYIHAAGPGYDEMVKRLEAKLSLLIPPI
jgi:hypothetical protein